MALVPSISFRRNVFFGGEYPKTIGSLVSVDPKPEAGDSVTLSSNAKLQQLEKDVQQRLKHYKYGVPLDALIQSDAFSANILPGGNLCLKNFRPIPASGSKTQGICEHLAYYMGQDLQKTGPKDLIIKGVSGTEPRFFNQPGERHVFLLAWPQSENERISRELSDKLRTNTLKELPKNCLLIDPSYQHCAKKLDGYTINEIFDLEKLNSPDKVVTSNQHLTPLGFLRDIAPDIAAQLKCNPLVSIGWNLDLSSDPIANLKKISSDNLIFPLRFPSGFSEPGEKLEMQVRQCQPIQALTKKIISAIQGQIQQMTQAGVFD